MFIRAAAEVHLIYWHVSDNHGCEAEVSSGAYCRTILLLCSEWQTLPCLWPPPSPAGYGVNVLPELHLQTVCNNHSSHWFCLSSTTCLHELYLANGRFKRSCAIWDFALWCWCHEDQDMQTPGIGFLAASNTTLQWKRSHKCTTSVWQGTAARTLAERHVNWRHACHNSLGRWGKDSPWEGLYCACSWSSLL